VTLLRIERLRVTLAQDVLLGIDLDLDRGETLGLVGESGSGKSMTALAIMGLLPPGARTAGRVLFDGVDLLAQDEAAWCRFRGAAAGMVFQEPMTALDPLMRVERQVAESLLAHRRLSRRAARAAAAALLERVGVRADVDTFPHRLSGGQRQRVMIAAALACGPALLIADEPTSALDVLVQARILDLLQALRAERGMAMLLVSHDLSVIARATARVAVMYAGRIVEQGSTQAVFRRLAHPYTRALHEASPHAAQGLPLPLPGRMPAPGALPPGCAFAPRCPRAQDDCVRDVPMLRGEAEHQMACLHPYP
jgi:peptide/nickel transport system ATP-binding protein